MKTLSRVFLIGAALAMLALPFAALAGERTLPITKKIQAGTTVVQYAGQSIRFVNPVPIVAKFSSTSDTAFDLEVWGYGTGRPGGQGPADHGRLGQPQEGGHVAGDHRCARGL